MQELKHACAELWLEKLLQLRVSPAHEQTPLFGRPGKTFNVDKTNGVSVGNAVHVGASVTGGSMVGVSKINGVDVGGAEIIVCVCAADDVLAMMIEMSCVASTVGVDVLSPVPEKITPMQQTEIIQIKIRLTIKIMTFVATPEADAVDLALLWLGVKDKPVPGNPTVGRIPFFPMFNVPPGLPMDVLKPRLLRLIRKPGAILNILRKRSGITSPNALDRFYK